MPAGAFSCSLQTPFKKLALYFAAHELCRIEFLDAATPLVANMDVHALEACAQIKRYCLDPKFKFSLPISLECSDFARRVYNAVAKIEVGKVKSYAEIASELVDANGVAAPSSARAVGQALAKNPLPIIIPCHRVVGTDNLGGYCSETFAKAPKQLLRVKAWLLLHEGALGAQVADKFYQNSND